MTRKADDWRGIALSVEEFWHDIVTAEPDHEPDKENVVVVTMPAPQVDQGTWVSCF